MLSSANSPADIRAAASSAVPGVVPVAGPITLAGDLPISVSADLVAAPTVSSTRVSIRANARPVARIPIRTTARTVALNPIRVGFIKFDLLFITPRPLFGRPRRPAPSAHPVGSFAGSGTASFAPTPSRPRGDVDPRREPRQPRGGSLGHSPSWRPLGPFVAPPGPRPARHGPARDDPGGPRRRPASFPSGGRVPPPELPEVLPADARIRLICGLARVTISFAFFEITLDNHVFYP